ncbi:glycosyltransferase [Candidatus Dependentiae bacterium]|nr:glycosyltransferase [Candidatus Dependentiae bacterium]
MKFIRRTIGNLLAYFLKDHLKPLNEDVFRHNHIIKYWMDQNIEKTYFVKNQIEEIRKSEKYNNAYLLDEPLVSIRIATYNKCQLLTERTIPSVLNQTYKNWELIIVGDGCDDGTEAALNKIRDKRISFLNLQRSAYLYPDIMHFRWCVAGIPPMNKGIELSKGEWLCHLDDDDEFTSDHIEVLLNKAKKEQFEFVYGAALMERKPDVWEKVGEYPLKAGRICHQAIMYNAALSFFKYNLYSWMINEPGDANMWRRLTEAGVKIGFVDHIVAKHYLEKRKS